MRCGGVPYAMESGTATTTPARKAKGNAMIQKVSSKRVAAIAGRILRGEPYSEAEAKALAASVISQAPAKPRERRSKKAGP